MFYNRSNGKKCGIYRAGADLQTVPVFIQGIWRQWANYEQDWPSAVEASYHNGAEGIGHSRFYGKENWGRYRIETELQYLDLCKRWSSPCMDRYTFDYGCQGCEEVKQTCSLQKQWFCRFDIQEALAMKKDYIGRPVQNMQAFGRCMPEMISSDWFNKEVILSSLRRKDSIFKYYFNEKFKRLPDEIKDELKIYYYCLPKRRENILTLEFDKSGNLNFCVKWRRFLLWRYWKRTEG